MWHDRDYQGLWLCAFADFVIDRLVLSLAFVLILRLASVSERLLWCNWLIFILNIMDPPLSFIFSLTCYRTLSWPPSVSLCDKPKRDVNSWFLQNLFPTSSYSVAYWVSHFVSYFDSHFSSCDPESESLFFQYYLLYFFSINCTLPGLCRTPFRIYCHTLCCRHCPVCR